MGWAIGYDSRWRRDIGYGVPATCDQPGCVEEIDRGLSFVCGNEPRGGEHGCGLYFCDNHLGTTYQYDEVCDGEGNFADEVEIQRCPHGLDLDPEYVASPDTDEWVQWKLRDPSWAMWRAQMGWSS